MHDEVTFASSTALLAIHSAISYTDALRVGLGDEKLAGDNHGQAVDALRGLLNTERIAGSEGLIHLHYLVSRKSVIAYGDRRLTETELSRLVIKAEMFAKWATGIAKQLRMEGWRHDD